MSANAVSPMVIDYRRGSIELLPFLDDVAVRGELDTGDIAWESSRVGKVGIEYKTAVELLGDFYSERVKSQLRRLRVEYSVKMLIVSGKLQKLPNGCCQTYSSSYGKYDEIIGFLTSVEASGIIVVRVETLSQKGEKEAVARYVRSLYASYLEKKEHEALAPSPVHLSFSDKPSYTGAMLTTLPGIGEVMAHQMLEKYDYDIVAILDGLRGGKIRVEGLSERNHRKIQHLLQKRGSVDAK